MPKSVTQGGQHRPALYGDCETVRRVLHWESLRVGSQVCMPDPLPGPTPRQTPPGRAAGPRAMSRAECRRASALEPRSVADAARLAWEGSGDPRTVPIPQELPPWYPSTLPNPSTHMPAGDHSSGLSSQPGDATTLSYPPGLQLTSWPELGGGRGAMHCLSLPGAGMGCFRPRLQHTARGHGLEKSRAVWGQQTWVPAHRRAG